MAITMRCVNRCFTNTFLTTAVFAAASLATANSLAQGAEYNYLLHCGGCHIEDGSGMPPDIPDLRVDMPFFASFAEGRAYMSRVPGVAQAPMTDEQLAGVMTWLMQTFSPPDVELAPFTAEEIALYKQEVLLNPQVLRDQLTDLRSTADASEQ